MVTETIELWVLLAAAGALLLALFLVMLAGVLLLWLVLRGKKQTADALDSALERGGVDEAPPKGMDYAPVPSQEAADDEDTGATELFTRERMQAIFDEDDETGDHDTTDDSTMLIDRTDERRAVDEEDPKGLPGRVVAED